MIGTKLAQFTLTSHLGSGGFGDVYQATDSKLGRSVAIKLLPEAFVRDADRVARFEREARVLASLNHPGIAAIYGLEESGGRRFLVMELAPGETLAERIKRGPIPVGEALEIAMQITNALEAAHEKGVIHRDLKPGNVMVMPDDRVKVLDFGLAKAYEANPSNPTSSNSPTLGSMGATNAGVILGTAAYMSPEQARGKTVDKRADIWAFGAVLFEMLTGQRAFPGEDLTDTLASVVKLDPKWEAIGADVSSRVRQVLRVCLQKDPRQRAQAIGDVRLALEGAFETAAPQTTAAATSSTPRGRTAWMAFAVAAVFAAVLAVPALRHLRETSPPEMRVEINTPPTTSPTSLAISPDGRKIVFAATDEGSSRLWLRSLDSTSALPLAGTDAATRPFWSPDNRSVGFFADGKLKRIDIDGGSVQTLAAAPVGFGGTWNSDGVILFVPTSGNPIFRVSATGGNPTAVTRLEDQQLSHRSPQFLPDGRRFLYHVESPDPERRGVYSSQLDGSETRRVLDADAGAVVAFSGQLLFVRQGTLFAQTFDPGLQELTGNPFPVAEQVTVGATFQMPVSASAAGPIVYRGAAGGGGRQFAWFDRSGKEIGKVGDPDRTTDRDPSISPDGRRVALNRTVNANSDVWLLDLGRGVFSRLTFDAAVDGYPLWSSDGSHVVFSSARKGSLDLYQRLADGGGAEALVLATAQTKIPTDLSPDGQFLLYRSNDPKTGLDLWALPLARDRKPFPVVQTNFEERDGQFSPDGKWIAYQSNESGRFEIYVQLFPGPGGKFQISTSGGVQVRWRRDGKELFYIALDGQLMAVPIGLAPNGQAVEAAAPVPLFATRVGGAVQGPYRQQYIVSPDGQRFLMNTVTEEASPITVILNWQGERGK